MRKVRPRSQLKEPKSKRPRSRAEELEFYACLGGGRASPRLEGGVGGAGFDFSQGGVDFSRVRFPFAEPFRPFVFKFPAQTLEFFGRECAWRRHALERVLLRAGFAAIFTRSLPFRPILA